MHSLATDPPITKELFSVFVLLPTFVVPANLRQTDFSLEDEGAAHREGRQIYFCIYGHLTGSNPWPFSSPVFQTYTQHSAESLQSPKKECAQHLLGDGELLMLWVLLLFTLHADEFLLILFPVCCSGNLEHEGGEQKKLGKKSVGVSVKLCRHLPSPPQAHLGCDSGPPSIESWKTNEQRRPHRLLITIDRRQLTELYLPGLVPRLLSFTLLIGTYPNWNISL